MIRAKDRFWEIRSFLSGNARRPSPEKSRATWAEPSEQGHSVQYGRVEPTLTTSCGGLLGKAQTVEVPPTEIISERSYCYDTERGVPVTKQLDKDSTGRARARLAPAWGSSSPPAEARNCSPLPRVGPLFSSIFYLPRLNPGEGREDAARIWMRSYV